MQRARQGEGGGQTVQGKNTQQGPQQKVGHRRGHDASDPSQNGNEPLDRRRTQNAPQQRGGQADVAVQVPPPAGVVPPAGAGELIEPVAGEPLRHRGVDAAAQEQEHPVLRQVTQGDADDHPRCAVDHADGAKEKASIHISPLPDGGRSGLQQPAQESVAEKEPDKTVKGFHSVSL